AVKIFARNSARRSFLLLACRNGPCARAACGLRAFPRPSDSETAALPRHLNPAIALARVYSQSALTHLSHSAFHFQPEFSFLAMAPPSSSPLEYLNSTKFQQAARHLHNIFSDNFDKLLRG